MLYFYFHKPKVTKPKRACVANELIILRVTWYPGSKIIFLLRTFNFITFSKVYQIDMNVHVICLEKKYAILYYTDVEYEKDLPPLSLSRFLSTSV